MKSKSQGRWVISPFLLGFIGVLAFGLICYIPLPMLYPQYFKYGITTFLKDPQSFHEIAVALSSKSWSEFTFLPEGQLPAGMLAFLYKLTSLKLPVVSLPLLAALAGFTIWIIASCLELLGVRGRWWPLFIGIFFTITPTSLSWMVYPHKDAFIVPGVLLILWSFISVILKDSAPRQYFAFFLGSLLVFATKYYFAELFLAGSLIAYPVIYITTTKGNRTLGRLAFFITAFGTFFILAFFKPGYVDDGLPKQGESSKASSEVVAHDHIPRQALTNRNWVNIPGGVYVNQPLRALALTRERFLEQRSYGLTNFREDIHLDTAAETLQYFPLALQLSVLEPTPWRKTEGRGARLFLFRAVQAETIIFYCFLIFLIFSGRKSWTPTVTICLLLSLPFLVAFGYAVPNIGAVNRYRFPFLMLLKIAGFSALWNSNRLKWPGRLLMWVDPPETKRKQKKVLFLVPDDATFVIQRLVMAQGLQKAGYEVQVACPDLGYGQKIRDLGFTFHHLDLNRGGLNPFADFLPFVRLVFFLAKERPDILQCVSIKPVIYGATAGTIVGLKRIVCLVNGLGYAFEGHGPKGRIVRYVATGLYRNALAMPGVRVIFQNPDDQKFFVDSRIVDANKTLLIRGSGVDMNKFSPSELPLHERPIILFVGRLLWSKGIRELVDAAIMLKKEGLQFRVKIVGAPDDRNPEAVPSAYLKEHHDNGVIEWMGRQTDMPKFYRESDILALPTAYREGLPLTLLEAASCGRPLITTDMPGCREIVRDGENGYLIPTHNSEALAGAMRKLIVDRNLRKKFGEASAEIVRQEFSSEIVQQKLLNVYESLYADSAHSSINSVTTA